MKKVLLFAGILFGLMPFRAAANTGHNFDQVNQSQPNYVIVLLYNQNPMDMSEMVKHMDMKGMMPETSNVTISDFEFSPMNINISQGTTVTWVNQGPSDHTITSDAGIFNSGMLNAGQQFQYTFNAPGTYAYHCSIHPSMTGVIQVN